MRRRYLVREGFEPVLGSGEMIKLLLVGIPRSLASASESTRTLRVAEDCFCGSFVEPRGFCLSEEVILHLL